MLKHDLSTLRILGSVGEPINPEAWKWYYRVIGKEKLPIIDTWWQTETGGFMISPASGIELTPLKTRQRNTSNAGQSTLTSTMRKGSQCNKAPKVF